MSRQIIYSNRGEVIDFDHIMAHQGGTVAVGNMSVNARGDVVGPGGVIVKTIEDVMSENGAGLRPAEPVRKVSIAQMAQQVDLHSMYESTPKPAKSSKTRATIDTSKGPMVDDFEE